MPALLGQLDYTYYKGCQRNCCTNDKSPLVYMIKRIIVFQKDAILGLDNPINLLLFIIYICNNYTVIVVFLWITSSGTSRPPLLTITCAPGWPRTWSHKSFGPARLNVTVSFWRALRPT